jgi:ketosteroid isomerase-like protein
MSVSSSNVSRDSPLRLKNCNNFNEFSDFFLSCHPFGKLHSKKVTRANKKDGIDLEDITKQFSKICPGACEDGIPIIKEIWSLITTDAESSKITSEMEKLKEIVSRFPFNQQVEQPQPVLKAADLVEQAIAHYAIAFEARDSQRIAKCYQEDSSVVLWESAKTYLEGMTEIHLRMVKALSGYEQIGIHHFLFKIQKIDVSGNDASAHVAWNCYTKKNLKKQKFHTFYYLQRADGEWKIVFSGSNQKGPKPLETHFTEFFTTYKTVFAKPSETRNFHLLPGLLVQNGRVYYLKEREGHARLEQTINTIKGPNQDFSRAEPVVQDQDFIKDLAVVQVTWNLYNVQEVVYRKVRSLFTLHQANGEWKIVLNSPFFGQELEEGPQQQQIPSH